MKKKKEEKRKKEILSVPLTDGSVVVVMATFVTIVFDYHCHC